MVERARWIFSKQFKWNAEYTYFFINPVAFNFDYIYATSSTPFKTQIHQGTYEILVHEPLSELWLKDVLIKTGRKFRKKNEIVWDRKDSRIYKKDCISLHKDDIFGFKCMDSDEITIHFYCY